MRAYERFLNYIQFDTASDESSETCPSTRKQLALANALVCEMRALGIADARVDDHGYVYGSIPATDESMPAIGLIAHMDVVDCVPCVPMRHRIIENYDGGTVVLDSGDVLDASAYPALKACVGKDLIVTDGRTILGADDKAGIAEILTAVELLREMPQARHGRIAIAFTPDEEIGRGADRFDVAGFGADFAYTVDGGAVGSIEYENFNAASAKLQVRGVSIHPGAAKDKMKNASLIAMEFASLLPPDEIPGKTEGYQGFFHLTDMTGEVEHACLRYIIRDHDKARFARRKEQFAQAAAEINRRYGEGTASAEIVDSYYNMREVLETHMNVVRRAEQAYRAVNIQPYAEPIRGGTDGARLSFMGLPCPNLATGGMNGHGRMECIAVQDMDVMAQMLVNLLAPQA